jgi:hypothetical protein
MTRSLGTSEEMCIGVRGKRLFNSSEFNHNLNIVKCFSQNPPVSDSMSICFVVLGLLFAHEQINRREQR